MSTPPEMLYPELLAPFDTHAIMRDGRRLDHAPVPTSTAAATATHRLVVCRLTLIRLSAYCTLLIGGFW